MEPLRKKQRVGRSGCLQGLVDCFRARFLPASMFGDENKVQRDGMEHGLFDRGPKENCVWDSSGACSRPLGRKYQAGTLLPSMQAFHGSFQFLHFTTPPVLPHLPSGDPLRSHSPHILPWVLKLCFPGKPLAGQSGAWTIAQTLVSVRVLLHRKSFARHFELISVFIAACSGLQVTTPKTLSKLTIA
jgi:hypothetical protein